MHSLRPPPSDLAICYRSVITRPPCPTYSLGIGDTFAEVFEVGILLFNEEQPPLHRGPLRAPDQLQDQETLMTLSKQSGDRQSANSRRTELLLILLAITACTCATAVWSWLAVPIGVLLTGLALAYDVVRRPHHRDKDQGT